MATDKKINAKQFEDICAMCDTIASKGVSLSEFLNFVGKNYNYKVQNISAPDISEFEEQIEDLENLKLKLEKSITNEMSDAEFDALRAEYAEYEADIAELKAEIARRIKAQNNLRNSSFDKADYDYCTQLYYLYSEKRNKENADASDFIGSFSRFNKYWNLYNKSVEVTDKNAYTQEFKDFFANKYEISDENLDLLAKLASVTNGGSLSKEDRNAIIEKVSIAIDDNHEKVSARKQHPKREALLKKGGSIITAIATGLVGGITAGVAATMSGAKLLTASVANAVILGSSAVTVGALGTAAVIMSKNLITKAYYRHKNTKLADLEKLAKNKMQVEDLKIIGLQKKINETSHKILSLKKHSNMNIFARMLRHAKNVINRNRIHATNNELRNVNKAISSLASNENISEKERTSYLTPLEAIRTRIANDRKNDVINSLAFSLITGKQQKLENLDIYAKGILRSKRRKEVNFVDACIREIIDETLQGKTTKLAGLRSEGNLNVSPIDEEPIQPVAEPQNNVENYDDESQLTIDDVAFLNTVQQDEEEIAEPVEEINNETEEVAEQVEEVATEDTQEVLEPVEEVIPEVIEEITAPVEEVAEPVEETPVAPETDRTSASKSNSLVKKSTIRLRELKNAWRITKKVGDETSVIDVAKVKGNDEMTKAAVEAAIGALL